MSLLLTGAGRIATTGTTYVGPGDRATFLVWGGLRAYSTATVGTACCRIQRASDSAQQDFNTLTNGNLDTASIATFLAATTGTVVTLYDKTGGGRDLVLSTAAPAYTASAIGSLPGMTFASASSTTLKSATTLTQAQPFGLSWVAKRTGSTSSFSGVIWDDGASEQSGFENVSGQVYAFTGASVLNTTYTEGNVIGFSAQCNGASSALFVNGTKTTGDIGNSTGLSANPRIGGGSGSVTGIVFEAGFTGALTDLNCTDLNTNQQTYWGY